LLLYIKLPAFSSNLFYLKKALKELSQDEVISARGWDKNNLSEGCTNLIDCISSPFGIYSAHIRNRPWT